MVISISRDFGEVLYTKVMEGTDENVAHAWDKNRLYIICGNEKREFDCLIEVMNIERIELNDWRATNLCCTNDS